MGFDKIYIIGVDLDFKNNTDDVALLNLLYNTCEKLLDILAIKIPNKM